MLNSQNNGSVAFATFSQSKKSEGSSRSIESISVKLEESTGGEISQINLEKTKEQLQQSKNATNKPTPPQHQLQLKAPPVKRTKRRRYADEEEIPDELWECVMCHVKAHMTPLKRRGADGKRNLCNACYVRLRVRKERSERGISRPVIPPGGFVNFDQPLFKFGPISSITGTSAMSHHSHQPSPSAHNQHGVPPISSHHQQERPHYHHHGVPPFMTFPPIKTEGGLDMSSSGAGGEYGSGSYQSSHPHPPPPPHHSHSHHHHYHSHPSLDNHYREHSCGEHDQRGSGGHGSYNNTSSGSYGIPPMGHSMHPVESYWGDISSAAPPGTELQEAYETAEYYNHHIPIQYEDQPPPPQVQTQEFSDIFRHQPSSPPPLSTFEINLVERSV